MDFQDMMFFLQKMPTETWEPEQIEVVCNLALNPDPKPPSKRTCTVCVCAGDADGQVSANPYSPLCVCNPFLSLCMLCVQVILAQAYSWCQQFSDSHM